MLARVKAIGPYIYSGSLLIILLLFVYYSQFHDDPPLSFAGESTISPKILKAGEPVTFSIPYCKHTSAIADPLIGFWKRQSDGLLWEIKEIPSSFAYEEGCSEIKAVIYTPDDLPPGKWQRIYRATFAVNPVASRTVEWKSHLILIIPEEEPDLPSGYDGNDR